jgi:hypothetical protein
LPLTVSARRERRATIVEAPLGILNALSYGSIGLAAVLAVLSYRLLSREAAREKPRAPMLASIRQYMYTALALLALAGLLRIAETYASRGDDPETAKKVADLTGKADELRKENGRLEAEKTGLKDELARLKNANQELSKSDKGGLFLRIQSVDLKVGGRDKDKPDPAVRVIINAPPFVFSYPGKELWEAVRPNMRQASFPVTSSGVTFEVLYSFAGKGGGRLTDNHFYPVATGQHTAEVSNQDTAAIIKYEISKEP